MGLAASNKWDHKPQIAAPSSLLAAGMVRQNQCSFGALKTGIFTRKSFILFSTYSGYKFSTALHGWEDFNDGHVNQAYASAW